MSKETKEAQTPQDTQPVMLDKRVLCMRLGISERTLENMVGENEFPPSVRIGKKVYWSEKTFLKWLQLRFAAQEAWRP